MSSKAVIFADGDPVKATLRDKLRKGRFSIVLDGAAEAVREQGWLPQLIAGDLDSIRPSTLRFFRRKGVEILETPDQNHTDLEKALAWCVLRNFSSIWIAQALGLRLDHSFTNLSLLRRFHHPKREVLLFRDGEKVQFVRNASLHLHGSAKRRVAILPFPSCEASSKGLLYELKNTRLDLGLKESTANQALKAKISLMVQGDALVAESLFPSSRTSNTFRKKKKTR